MDKFAKKLAKILKENEEVSVYGMAKETGCNRTWLQKILAGERAMSIKYIRKRQNVKKERQVYRHVSRYPGSICAGYSCITGTVRSISAKKSVILHGEMQKRRTMQK